ncbi:uncharacterized protein LOC126416900 [Schistocerca serialis cubense]|uniref:uncharacterized protein LOC126416900 n=1 Tax=Schistocerca serialis cubense TaxID=2023355 RepID=UPI00214E16BF|nr:uncharacterized protein LOC126416900 [Schistocerca serialis cubense]
MSDENKAGRRERIVGVNDAVVDASLRVLINARLLLGALFSWCCDSAVCSGASPAPLYATDGFACCRDVSNSSLPLPGCFEKVDHGGRRAVPVRRLSFVRSRFLRGLTDSTRPPSEPTAGQEDVDEGALCPLYMQIADLRLWRGRTSSGPPLSNQTNTGKQRGDTLKTALLFKSASGVQNCEQCGFHHIQGDKLVSRLYATAERHNDYC